MDGVSSVDATDAALSAEPVLDDAPATDGKPRVKPRIIAMQEQDSAAKDKADAASSAEIEAAMKIQKAVRLRQVRIAKGEVQRHIPGTALKGQGFADVVEAEAVVQKIKLGERIAQSEVLTLARTPNPNPNPNSANIHLLLP